MFDAVLAHPAGAQPEARPRDGAIRDWAERARRLALDLSATTPTLLPDLLGMGSVSARAAFVIDRNGAVQYSEQTPTPKDLPNFNAITETLAKLK